MIKTTQSLTLVVQSFNTRKDESLHIADLESAIAKSKDSQMLDKFEKSYIGNQIGVRGGFNISRLDHSVIGKGYLSKFNHSVIPKNPGGVN